MTKEDLDKSTALLESMEAETKIEMARIEAMLAKFHFHDSVNIEEMKIHLERAVELDPENGSYKEALETVNHMKALVKEGTK